MKSKDHEQQADHNIEFVRSLNPDDPQFPDWVITGSFYIALHCVDSHAARAGVRFKSGIPVSLHAQRRQYVLRYIRRLYTTYDRLFQESQNARYDPLYFSFVGPDESRSIFALALEFRKIV